VEYQQCVDAYQNCQIITGKTRKQFARLVDDDLRGSEDRIPVKRRTLRGLVERYGWDLVLASAERMAKQHSIVQR